MRKFVTFNVCQILGQYSNSEEDYIVQSCNIQEVNSCTYFVGEPKANAPYERQRRSVINTWECQLNWCFYGLFKDATSPEGQLR
jgi:hypothetical protein